jgi:hypothetical protein
MNDYSKSNCERVEAMMGDWLDQSLSAGDRRAVSDHLATCASCRESVELASRIESALVARSEEIPAVDAFLPPIAGAPHRVMHPQLVRAFRVVMSPAGVAALLVVWIAMLTLRFREPIAAWITSFPTERVETFMLGIQTALLDVSGGNMLTLITIYAALAVFVLASTGAITLRYIRNS